MSYQLVIAEKPSVGRDIARVLGCKQQGKKYIEGNEYIVTWGLGHLVTLADPEGYDKKLKTWRMEDLPMMPERFKLVVIPQTMTAFSSSLFILFKLTSQRMPDERVNWLRDGFLRRQGIKSR